MKVCVMQWKCAQCEGNVRNVHQYMVHTYTVLQGCTSQRCISLGAHQYMVHTTTVPQGCTSQRCISLGAHQRMVHTTATGVRFVQWVVLIGLCVRIQRTPAKNSSNLGAHNFWSISSRTLCFGYEVDEYVFYIMKKRAPDYVACEPSNGRNAGPPFAAASRRTLSKHMPDLSPKVLVLESCAFDLL